MAITKPTVLLVEGFIEGFLQLSGWWNGAPSSDNQVNITERLFNIVLEAYRSKCCLYLQRAKSVSSLDSTSNFTLSAKGSVDRKLLCLGFTNDLIIDAQ